MWLNQSVNKLSKEYFLQFLSAKEKNHILFY